MSAKNAAPVKYADAPVNKALSPEQKIKLYRDMCRIRRFELVALKHYNSGKMGGFLHLYNGQESVAVGCVSLMGENDHIITAYRDHGHALAVGMGMNECMAELFGKKTGCSKGKGGSMHFFAPDKNYWGGHGIVAGQTPLGAGLAFGVKYKGLKGCSLCFLGDGAVNQGAFHESLNLAALFDLPVVYIIENNGYSMGTSQKRSSAYPGCLAERAEGYGMKWELLNGEDIYEVRARVNEAMVRAREESKPMLLEVLTYRYYGHSVADAMHKKYRTKEEIEKREREHDPVIIFRNHLINEKVLTEKEATEIDQAASKEAEDSGEFAEQSPLPDPSEIFDDIYWEVDNGTEAGQTGRHFFND
ncbi:pyruvate dehydrogenase E1 component alpha subunit [Roseimicrobium gellanilyticum]|uniref:Pyruvate dehydrogenase E1 component subunit alpha n=1 Tax=Roseimicrobium gellanilyticum TaxID=748857 RepID=A0A366HCU5_9BACT|nr:pyruvate dehydrogenase (acetyl-transferring) E1 component subunit alpha [Roseimicrobium gellanilyticum]RBP39800.1 pyruvate dehydrogenase E1 component alpha subunit [Roseimicrobium gellanilyticum]